MKIELHPGEIKIDTWAILYIPPNGGKYNGKLTITNKRLLYDARFDGSGRGLLPEALFMKWGREGYLEINKDLFVFWTQIIIFYFFGNTMFHKFNDNNF